MSPKEADPNVRLALIEQGARLLAEEGSKALTLRRLTKLVGASTMAVYTHFGSMDDLHRAIRDEGFARLAAGMEAVETTDDPLADLGVLGWAYIDNALRNPRLYAVMFVEDRNLAPEPRAKGQETFTGLLTRVERCLAAGRFRPEDPVDIATQMWIVVHGIATLAISGHLTEDEAFSCLQRMGANLFRTLAVDPPAVDESLDRALSRVTALLT